MRRLTPEEIHKRWLEMPMEYRRAHSQIVRHHQIMRWLLRVSVALMILTQIAVVVWSFVD
ncbi:hypothetical protein QT972_25445 [Microcoleus sp. herbarium7]|uniref:hypothetical protein n=1 Tax=Microcoleus sp. herbarium7 TaxID=3055435 RepID=UPI002FD5F752